MILQRLGTPDEAITHTTWAELDRTVEPDHLTALYIPHLADAGRRRVRAVPPARPDPARAVPVGHRADPPHADPLRDRGDLRARRCARGPEHHATSQHRRPERRRASHRRARRPALPDRVPRDDRRTAGPVHDRRRGAGRARQARAPPPPRVRHDIVVDGTETVLRNWDAIKRAEKGRGPTFDGRSEGVFDGIPGSFPSLSYAHEVQKKAAKVGFDWPDVDGALAKIVEEAAELGEAAATSEPDAVRDELGDLLFAVVNVARHLGVDPGVGVAGGHAEVPGPLRGRRGARPGGRPRARHPRDRSARRVVGTGQARTATLTRQRAACSSTFSPNALRSA